MGEQDSDQAGQEEEITVLKGSGSLARFNE